MIKNALATCILLCCIIELSAQTDIGWMNGQSRLQTPSLTFRNKNGDTIAAGVAFADAYYNYNFNGPKDNTHTVSGSIGRHNEFTLNQVSLGIETVHEKMIGRIFLQFGQMGSIVHDLDGSVQRGRNTSIQNLRFIREASAGYKITPKMNAEMGIFTSYIGLESYVLNENWNYQRSMVSELTPFYLTGARFQFIPSSKFKTELWLLNGWQTYNSWGKGIGAGNSNYYRPNDNLQFVVNFYYGKDTRNSNRIRFHHDNSIVARYYKKSTNEGISQAAFSLNTHYGFENGDGIKPREHYMAGSSLANRVWFKQNKYALTLRGDFITNPGLYLAFSPSPVTPNDFIDAAANDPDKRLTLKQFTATFDVMPNDHFTFRIEYGTRNSNLPYFAGRDGTTSPDGWINTPASGWRPDLRKADQRFTASVSFRL